MIKKPAPIVARKVVLAGAMTLSLLSFHVQALSVGEMNVASHLGDPLNISIDLNALKKSEFSSLDVSLASPSLFKQTGIAYPDNAKNLKVSVEGFKNGRAKIRVRSLNAISEPFLHLLLNISWAGGNILREYTALIDPADYATQALTQAVAPNTKLGIVKRAQNATPNPEFHGRVRKGDSLSAIAALYRPADVSMQQAWMAFYNLNREAFPENNLNSIKKGAQIRVPSRAQMLALSPSNAMKKVKQLSKTSRVVSQKRSTASRAAASLAVAKPTLTVGGQSDGAATKTRANAQALGDAGYDQMASIITEIGNFKIAIQQELSASRNQNEVFKEELIASRGENRVLTERMGQVEAQLSKISQLLSLQSQALQNLNAGILSGEPSSDQTSTGIVDTELEVVNDANVFETAAITPSVVERVSDLVTPEVADDIVQDMPEELSSDLVQSALDNASSEDKSYVDAIIQDSATAIGMPDPNPVSQQMLESASPTPSGPALSGRAQNELMLANVKSALSTLQADLGSGETGALAQADNTNSQFNLETQDLAYITALNSGDRAKLEESEGKIVALEQALQTKIEAAKRAQTDVAQIETTPVKTVNAPVMDADNNSELGLLSKLKAQFSSSNNPLGSISSDMWKLIAGVGGVGLLSLFLMKGVRRRMDNEFEEDGDSILDIDDDDSQFETVDIDLDNLTLGDEGISDEEVDAGLEEQLHGSSLFDLSDESFMASEAVQNDSSLFAMDDQPSTQEDMDSTQVDQQSTMTQVVDVDPIAEAEVYLAYDRKEQAIKVLEESLAQNPNQSAVVTKLLSLYQGADDIDSFTKLFESSAEHIEDDGDWNKIKLMAREFAPGHGMLQDDFDSSIPVLNQKIEINAEANEAEVDEPVVKEKINLDLSMDDAETDTAADLTMETQPTSDTAEEIDLDLSLDTPDDALDLEAASLSLADDTVENIEEALDDAMEEVNQHDPETALALAKAYIELGEDDIAKDFLNDVVNAGKGKIKTEAKKLLKDMS